MTTRDHMLPLAKWVLAFRILQLVTAVAVLGLAGYGLTFLVFDGIALTLFSAVASIIIVIYVLVATYGAPVMYNYWAILGLDIFAVIFWLISFGLLAAEIAAYQWVVYNSCDSYYYYCYKAKRDMDLAKRATTDLLTYRNALAAAAGLGGLSFIFFIITLAGTGVLLHRHRKAGGHCMPGRSGVDMSGTYMTNPTEPKYEPQPISNTQAPAPQYTADHQQPAYGQQQPAYGVNPPMSGHNEVPGQQTYA